MEISYRIQRFIALAEEMSQYSDHRSFRHGSLIVRGGKVMGRSFNKSWAHAEARLIKKLGPEVCRGATLYVTREGNAMSKPCEECMKAIRESGISKIIYTNRASNIKIERI